jgi:hypothetical protein
MKDFLRVCEVAKLRGAEVRFAEAGQWSAYNRGKLIALNVAEISKFARGLQAGADSVACEWAVATWVVAHELGHYELHGGADLAQCDTDSGYEELLEDEADMFARRFLRETVGLPASEAAERCGLIANQIETKAQVNRPSRRR